MDLPAACLLLRLQLLFDAGAAYSLFMTAGFFALGPPFFGRTVLVLAGDFLAIYFAICLLFDIVTLTSVLISTARLGTTPVAFFDGELCFLCCLDCVCTVLLMHT